MQLGDARRGRYARNGPSWAGLPELEAGEDRPGIERTLASGRAFLAIAALIAIYLDPTEPTRYATFAYALLLAYAATALGVVALLRFVRLTPRHLSFVSLLCHTGDVCFAAVVTLFTAGPNSPFFVFFVFALMAAAHRWGLVETLATAGAAVVLLVVEAMLVDQDLSIGVVEGQFELNRLVIRATYLVMVGVLVGYLGERQRELRREQASIGWVLAKPRVNMGVKGTMQVVFEAVLRLFDSQKLLCVAEDQRTGQIVEWEASFAPDAETATVTWRELDRAASETYLFPAPGHSWHLVARRRGDEASRDALVLDDQGHRVSGASVTVPDVFSAAHAARSLLAVTLPAPEEWTGRVFVFDPAMGSDRERRLQFAQRLVREVAPTTYNIYLLHGLRSRAEAMERARLARELHDGITQSLISVEMQVDLLRRQAESEAPRIAGELGRIRALLQHEVLGLRELMQQMKAFHVGPGQLLDHLADIVDRFQHDTGIAARFMSNLRQDEVRLAPRACREVAQIVHEGLVNTRKHSGARHVFVSLTASNGHVKLSIDDDGRGFPFSGRFAHAELEHLRKGPQVIKERTRSLGGELTLESTPGLGSRLEISFR